MGITRIPPAHLALVDPRPAAALRGGQAAAGMDRPRHPPLVGGAPGRFVIGVLIYDILFSLTIRSYLHLSKIRELFLERVSGT